MRLVRPGHDISQEYSRAAGWWNAPSHTTYKSRLTSKSAPPIIGLTGLGLLHLRRVGTRLQAARDLGSQEGGAPCPSSRLPTQLAHCSPAPSCPLKHLTAVPAVPAVPPVHEGSGADVLGTTASGQSPTAALPAYLLRRLVERQLIQTPGGQQSCGEEGPHDADSRAQ